MAYYTDPNDPNQKKPQAAPTDSSPFAPLTAAGGGAGGNTPAAKPNASGQFLSYDRLLNANQGVGQQMANRLTSQATGAAGQAQSALSSANDTFNRAVDAGTTSANPVAAPVGPATGVPARVSTGPGMHMQAIPNPANYQPRIDSLNQQITNAQYTGPTTPTGYFDDAQSKALSAAQQLQGLGTVAGRQAQLGGSLFDALLAGSQGGGQLNRAAQQANQLPTAVNQALTTAQNTAEGGAQSVANWQNSLRKQLQQVTDTQTKAGTDAQNQQQAAQQSALQDQQYEAFQKSKPGTMNVPGITDMSSAEFDALSPDQKAFLASGGAYVNGGMNLVNGKDKPMADSIRLAVSTSRSKK